jgi:hypothetical protein
MYLIDDGNGSAVAVHARIRDHLAAHLDADRIDRELAHGASPEASIELALRSRVLSSTRTRHLLAHGLRRAIARANAPSSGLPGVVRLNRAEIISATPDIMELHRLLITGGPVSVHGVAQTHILLTCGAGPLYSRRAAAHLGRSLRRAIQAMNILDTSMSTHVQDQRQAIAILVAGVAEHPFRRPGAHRPDDRRQGLSGRGQRIGARASGSAPLDGPSARVARARATAARAGCDSLGGSRDGSR